MMQFFFEAPWIPGIIGAVITGALFFAWIQSGVSAFGKAAIGAVLVTIGLILINVLVKTDKEELSELMQSLARDLQGNRFDEVRKKIHPDATMELRNLQSRIEGVEFQTVLIKKIHGIEVVGTREPKSANVRMNVIVEGRQGGSSGTVPRWVRIFLEQLKPEGAKGDLSKGEWRIVDYEHRDPQYEMLNQQGRDRLDSMYRR